MYEPPALRSSHGICCTAALEQVAPGMLRILPVSICSIPQRPAAEWVAFASDSARCWCYQTSCYCYLAHTAATAQLGFVLLPFNPRTWPLQRLTRMPSRHPLPELPFVTAAAVPRTGREAKNEKEATDENHHLRGWRRRTQLGTRTQSTFHFPPC